MIHFDPTTHAYFNLWGDRYLSSTQLVSQFKAPFDSLPIATAYAAKHGNSPEYWIARWAEKRDFACDRGTAFHEQREQAILAMAQAAVYGERLHVVRDIKSARQKDGSPFPQALASLPDGLYCELLLWNDAARIAGTADLVAIETDQRTGIRYIDIDDHKTNERIEVEGFYSRATGRKMMLRPLDHLHDCNKQHYELQLSVYAWMLERAGFVVRRLGFTHYPQDENGAVGKRQPVKYPVDYLRREVEMMVEFRSEFAMAGQQ